uniref:uncharacterized protein LOC120339727 n=1 Tax=Styela clava TaxID=7725 RepID=UPI00193AC107|nr:uncharacterized protein LOC120339727 [Styela clava]
METWKTVYGASIYYVITLLFTLTIADITQDTNQKGVVNVASSYMFRPNLRTAEGVNQLRTLRDYRRTMRANLEKSLIEQITFDEKGDILPGQKICLPLMSQRSVDEIKIDGLPHGTKTHPSLNPNLFVVRTVRNIIKGDFEKQVGKMVNEKTTVPQHSSHWRVDYRHETNQSVDLGYDFDLNDESFTIVALIRLRPKSGEPIRGARILSKRSSDNRGWEFVVPSYYGQTISFYANIVPGHIDYGKSSLPENTWTAVGIIFDRHTYADNVALITPFIDGFPDGQGTYLEVLGNLSSVAPLTVGHWKDETGAYSRGRRDYRLPGSPRFNPHFQGDIRDIFIWKKALTKQQMRIKARHLLREMGRRPSPCPNGYQELDCMCYQVYNELKTFSAAEARCTLGGGTLAMPKTGRIQDFLEILMQQSERVSFWIGLDDRGVEREKFWADGTRCLYNRRRNETDYNKFPNSQPDKQYHTEDCVEEVKRKHDFWWNDENCIKLNAFICEVQSSKQSCSVGTPDAQTPTNATNMAK